MDPVLVNLVKMPYSANAVHTPSLLEKAKSLHSPTKPLQAKSSSSRFTFTLRQQYLALSAFTTLCAISLYTTDERIPKFHVCLILSDLVLYGYTTTRFWHEYRRYRTRWIATYLIKATLFLFCTMMGILIGTDLHEGQSCSWVGGWVSFVLSGYSIVETVVRVGMLQGLTR